MLKGGDAAGQLLYNILFVAAWNISYDQRCMSMNIASLTLSQLVC